jgi:3'-phosphoadenosine 5'-phosphosulfate (PAPS) 3'-phosphatase
MLNDAFYAAYIKSIGYWDICAGHALLKELGGGVYNENREEFVYTNEEPTGIITGLLFMSPYCSKICKFVEKLGSLEDN